MGSVLSWFEIPAKDLERAVKFYNTVLGIELIFMDMGPEYPAYMFPGEGDSGAIVQGEGYNPSATDGPFIYIRVADVAENTARVVAAGGQVTREKMSIGENGFIAYMIDSEGNRIGLHSVA